MAILRAVGVVLFCLILVPIPFVILFGEGTGGPLGGFVAFALIGIWAWRKWKADEY